MPLEEFLFTGNLNYSLPLGGKKAHKSSGQTSAGGGWVGRGVVKTQRTLKGRGAAIMEGMDGRGPY